MDRTLCIQTEARHSRLLGLLAGATPYVLPRLQEREAWAGWWLSEPEGSGGYLRVVCRDELRIENAALVVAVHLFEQPCYRGPLHNHRWPLAVLPFAVAPQSTARLYAMPWELRDNGACLAAGEFDVQAGAGWAIEDHVRVYHAVRSDTPHGSLNVTDVSRPPSREDRIRSRPAADADVVRALNLAAARLRVRPGGNVNR